MALHSRMKRINEEMHHAIAGILQSELKDPRIGTGLVTVTDVFVSKDLHNAQVWISVLGSDEAAKAAMEALEHSRGFIKRLLAERVVVKYIPELHFRLDTTGRNAARINELLKQVEPAGSPHEDPGE